jgi:hypothetical protein
MKVKFKCCDGVVQERFISSRNLDFLMEKYPDLEIIEEI